MPETPEAAPENTPEIAPEADPKINYDDFCKIDLRVAKVIEANVHPNADKLLVLKIDLGSEQRQLIAGLKEYYSPESLVGKNIVVVANLAPRKMRGLESDGMLLAASCEEDGVRRVIVVSPDSEIAAGSSVS